MPDTLYGPAASLLQGAAQTMTETANRDEKERQANADRSVAQLTASDTNQRAMDVQKLAGQQAIAQKLAEAKAAALAEKEKFDRESITVTPALAKGFAKAAGNPGLEDLAGKQLDQTHFGVVVSASMRSKYLKPQKMSWKNADGKEVTGMAVPTEDENGVVTWTGQEVGGAIPKPGSSKSDSSTSWYKKAQDSLKTLSTAMGKKGGIPSESLVQSVLSKWGHRNKDNDSKIANLKQNYSDYQTAVDNYNALAEKEGKSPITIDPQVAQAMDTVLSLGGPAAPANNDQAVSDFLKAGDGKRPYADNPENRAWAKEQLAPRGSL